MPLRHGEFHTRGGPHGPPTAACPICEDEAPVCSPRRRATVDEAHDRDLSRPPPFNCSRAGVFSRGLLSRHRRVTVRSHKFAIGSNGRASAAHAGGNKICGIGSAVDKMGQATIAGDR